MKASRRRRSPGEYAMGRSCLGYMWILLMTMMYTFLFDSSSTDDAPEPQRLEPVGVQGREVDDRVGPDRDADERGAPPLIVPSATAASPAWSACGKTGGRSCRPRPSGGLGVSPELVARSVALPRLQDGCMWATKFNCLRRAQFGSSSSNLKSVRPFEPRTRPFQP